MMTDDEKLAMLTQLMAASYEPGDMPSYDTLSAYLALAEKTIIGWLYGAYPDGAPDTVVSVPAQYEDTQIMAVIVGLGLSGAEGQTVHNENGISRSFSYPDMAAYIRRRISPYAYVG